MQRRMGDEITLDDLADDKSGFMLLGSAQMYQQMMRCHDRGYHRVSDDKREDPLVCYDCEILFGKDEGSVYRVVPHYDSDIIA